VQEKDGIRYSSVTRVQDVCSSDLFTVCYKVCSVHIRPPLPSFSSVCVCVSHAPICPFSFVLNDFHLSHIDISLLLERPGCSFPASVVISNVTTGSVPTLSVNHF